MSKKRKVEKSINKAKEIGFGSDIFQDIHTVFGEEGEYSDREVWTVCSYENKEMAIEHVKEANKYVQKYKQEHRDDQMSLYNCKIPYDTNMEIGRNVRSLVYYTHATKIIKVVTK